jgi:hypothetical protein
MTEVMYRLELGKSLFNKHLHRKTYFVGQCYKCGSWKHTQHFCPLQQCSECSVYGHHVKVCKKKKASVYTNFI